MHAGLEPLAAVAMYNVMYKARSGHACKFNFCQVFIRMYNGRTNYTTCYANTGGYKDTGEWMG